MEELAEQIRIIRIHGGCLTKAMLRSDRKRILMADYSKPRARGYIAYGGLQDFDLWITTPGPGMTKRDQLQKKVEILEAAV